VTDYRERAKQYHEAIRAILLKEWDPIGVSHIPEAQDEYDRYVGGVYRLLITHVDRRAFLSPVANRNRPNGSVRRPASHGGDCRQADSTSRQDGGHSIMSPSGTEGHLRPRPRGSGLQRANRSIRGCSSFPFMDRRADELATAFRRPTWWHRAARTGTDP